ncbi:MAG: amino acid permease [bacterium]|nr:amino acid permease [bacterium]
MPQDRCTSDNNLFSEESDYKRDLGLLEATSIVIGRIIGSGIFRTPAPIMLAVASTGLFGLVWVLGGIITIFSAVCYAELVAMMPKSGGPYVYLRAAYNPVWSFLRGWAMFFVSETASIAAVALVFSDYLNALWKIQFGDSLSQLTMVIIALGTIWLLTVINLFGVVLSGRVQNFFSTFKILALGAIIGFCFIADGNGSNFTTPFLPEEFSWGTILAVGTGLRYCFFAFSGWEGATYIAEEVKNPRKNLPLSLFFGIGGVMLLYAGANSAYIYQLPVETIMTSKEIAADAMRIATTKMTLGSIGGVFISIAVMFSTFGNVSTQILCKARSWQAMSRDGVFFKKLGEIHPRYKTPNNALLAQALWASVLLLLAAYSPHVTEIAVKDIRVDGELYSLEKNDHSETKQETLILGTAEETSMITYKVKKKYLKKAEKTTPGLESFFLSGVREKEWTAVKAGINTSELSSVVKKLNNLGKQSAYETIIDFFFATGIIFNIMTFLSVFVLRRKYPDMVRPYKAWFYPYGLIIVVVFYLVLLGLTLISAFIPSMLGLVLTSTGLIYYQLVVKKRTPESDVT